MMNGTTFSNAMFVHEACRTLVVAQVLFITTRLLLNLLKSSNVSTTYDDTKIQQTFALFIPRAISFMHKLISCKKYENSDFCRKKFTYPQSVFLRQKGWPHIYRVLLEKMLLQWILACTDKIAINHRSVYLFLTARWVMKIY